MIIHKCDKCDTISKQKAGEVSCPPSDWKEIRFTMVYVHYPRSYEICPKCADMLGLSGDTRDYTPTLADNLLEIIGAIVDERIQP